MPEPGELKRHIVFSGRTAEGNFTNPGSGGSGLVVKERNRSEHGRMLKAKLLEIKEAIEAEVQIPEGLINENVVYVEFVSDFNVKLAFDSFEDAHGKYHFLKCEEDGEKYHVVVVLNSRGISSFINKIDAYLTKTTRSGEPRNQKLFNNILEIKLATLRSFWNEPTIEFPRADEEIWWEVWLRRSNLDPGTNEDEKVVTQLAAGGVAMSDRRLLFPEHIVRLVKATRTQLSTPLLLLDNLAELRKAKDTADFFADLTNRDQVDWMRDMISRTDNHTNDDSIVVCILDTGVNNGHPLLNSFLPDANMDSYNPAWGKQDGHPGGHGTQMAGLALYGDLTDPLVSTERLQLYHRLESVKMINASVPHTPDIYGQVTIECVSRASILKAGRKRVFCMAITADDSRDHGRPSSWSTAVDQIIFGNSGTSNDKVLFFVSGGNVYHDVPEEYPSRNVTDSVHDPAQAFNAITVGGYTEKDTIDLVRFPGCTPMARRGGMAPANSTSCTWKKWPIKPDVVFEAGNYGIQGNAIISPDSLLVLTTAKDFSTHQFTTFGATSCATALGSLFAAQLWHEYPALWPESIRGMMLHSATWTEEMRNRKALHSMTWGEKNELIRTFGFGVPSLDKARYSLNNSLTLIAERELQPFRIIGSSVKTSQMHAFDLPWPKEVLEAMGAAEVRLSVTLSYFVEPNPGSRYYSSKFNYQSHGLRFKIKRPLESVNEFTNRINRAVWEDDERPTRSEDSDKWLLGEKIRNTGSVQKDIWVGTAADLASMNTIAVFPINGWWRFRKKLERYDKRVRYSLIITLETDETEVDLYTPVYNMITVQV